MIQQRVCARGSNHKKDRKPRQGRISLALFTRRDLGSCRNCDQLCFSLTLVLPYIASQPSLVSDLCSFCLQIPRAELTVFITMLGPVPSSTSLHFVMSTTHQCCQYSGIQMPAYDRCTHTPARSQLLPQPSCDRVYSQMNSPSKPPPSTIVKLTVQATPL